jgi:ankyrin repeat protein
VRLLLQFTPSPRSAVNIQTATGWTPLHSALQRSCLEVAKTLVFHGADLTIKNNEGYDCAHAYDRLLNHEITTLSRSLPSLTKGDKTNFALSGVSIQIASDLHLEFFHGAIDFSSIILPSAPVLALLGDIGIPLTHPSYERFLLCMADKFELVLVVAGNHGL